MDQSTHGNAVTRGADGIYRWVYEVNLYKDLSIYFLIWRIFFFIFIAIFTVVMIADANRLNNFYPDRLVSDLKFLGFFLIGMTVVTALGYLIYAAIMGGKYIVEFEMNEKGILHRQTASQAKKAKKIGQAAMIAGAASGRLTAVGVGAGAQRTEMYSDFAKTSKVKAYPRRGLIKVRAGFEHNRVYARKEDFAFVESFIRSHCPNLIR